ncbi:hypothetical protein CQW23_28168 [Capsicum baccatum]|uniref:Uncharacterized protein n=1 Tax=Capsicum baccatum TaxID=33114 RepID=A0A2G2VFR6_CAPBA|nr:hypothetical protein CQW23_28168 [Capsicum baccatum]
MWAVYFPEWQVGEESFLVLEELQMHWCNKLMEIPETFGDITSLKSIQLHGCPQLENSALRIKEYVAEMTGEEDKLEGKCKIIMLIQFSQAVFEVPNTELNRYSSSAPETYQELC